MKNIENNLTAENFEITGKIESLADIVKSSAAENEKKDFTQQSVKAPKRGRGRPRKDGKPNKNTLSMMGLDVDPLADPTPSPAAQAEGIDVAPAAPALDLPPALLKPVLQMPFNILRARTGFDGFNLPDDVAGEMTPLLQHVMNQYLPSTDSEHAPAVLLAGMMGMTLFTQWTAYQDWKREKQTSKPQSQRPTQVDPIQGVPFEHVKSAIIAQ